MSGLDVAARERAIMKYLRDAPAQGASVREIYDTVSAQLGDTVSRPAYYKILDRMEATGKLELAPTPGGERRYALTTTLHIGNAITLDDVYEMLPYVETTEALARAWDAQDYYEEHRKTVIKRAAEALLDEDPVDLFCRMILDLVRTVEADIAMLRHKGERGATELADTVTRARLEEDYRALEHVAYRGLSVPHSALRLPGLRGVELGKDVWCDPGRLRQALRQRVFGATFIREVNVAPLRALEARQQLTVSGSDGSIHAGTLALQSAKGYLEDISDIITFNNSAVYIRLSPRLSKKQGRADMAHSAPFTR
jgi:Fe2+ or Zn2+ uptake regulation protein